jgi:tetratricopeptide (TPR) repeat protein
MHEMKQIEAYVSGLLSETDRIAFEQQMASDPELAALVDNYDLISDVRDVLIEEDVREVLTRKSVPRSRQVRTKRLRFFLATAAILALAITTVTLINLQNSTDRIFTRHFEPYPSGALRGVNDRVSDGLTAYDHQDYANALAHWNAVDRNSPEYLSAQIYVGNALLAHGEAELAIIEFSEIIDRKDARFTQAAQWYLALAYLKAGKRESSIAILMNIQEFGTHAYQARAQELLNKLQ